MQHPEGVTVVLQVEGTPRAMPQGVRKAERTGQGEGGRG